MDNFIDELNEQQKEAVTTTEGYVRIIAGAGTGKTKALTYRYAYLVDELGISTSNILCVTFTNKAAREMSKRIRQMIGDSDTGYICTFHGFCVKLLSEASEGGYPCHQLSSELRGDGQRGHGGDTQNCVRECPYTVENIYI